MKASSVLGRVFELLAASKCETQDDWHQHRKEISDALDIANGLAKAPPSLQEFETFLKEGHDLHVYADSIVKSAMFRIMRLCISPQSNESSPRNCQAFVEAMKAEEWYWLVIASLEREPLQERESDERGGDGEVIRQDFVLERMQALKLIRCIMQCTPSVFPLAFARSLVAVSESNKENIRRVCLETLRELCVLNPRLAVESQAFETLLETVFDPSMFDLIDSIVNTILFMLTNPLSRCVLRPHLHLRALIAPFTDIDADEKAQLPRLKAAKVALAAILRTWTGAVLLASDDLGLPTLIRMLRDSKVSIKAQDMLLDTIAEAFERVFAKAMRGRLTSVGNNRGYKVVTMDSGTAGTDDSTLASSSSTPSNEDSHGAETKAFGATPINTGNGSTAAPPAMEGIRESTVVDNSQPPAARIARSGGNGHEKNENDKHSSAARVEKQSGVAPFSATNKDGSTKVRRTSFMSAMNFWGGGGKASGSAEENEDKLGTGDSNATGKPQRRPSGGGLGALFAKSRSNSRNGAAEAGLTGLSRSPSAAGSMPPSPADNRPSSGSAVQALNEDAYWSQRLNAGRSNTVDSIGGISSAASAEGGDRVSRRVVGVDTFIDNVLYNVVDNYAAIVCCALIHSEVVESLCYLGTRGPLHLANKARVLLVEFLRTLAHILPEASCVDFLSIPSLVEFSTSIHAGGMTNRAHKAGQLLSALADAFSVAPRHFRVSPACVPDPVASSDLNSHNKRNYKRGLGSYEDGGKSGAGQASGVSDKDRDPFYQFLVAGTDAQGTDARGQLSLCEASEHLKHFYDPYLSLSLLALRKLPRKQLNSSNVLTGVARLDSNLAFQSSGNYSYRSDTDEMGTDATSTQMKAIQALRLVSSSNNPNATDFMRMIENSRVNSNYGKEPFRWDWAVIYEILEYGFGDTVNRARNGLMGAGESGTRSGLGSISSAVSALGSSGSGQSSIVSDRLKLAMNTKWVKRLCGFYRCSSDVKGYFASLPWDIANLTYFSCACSLYNLLSIDPVGQDFLRSDRRGMLFNEIATELKSLVDAVEKPVASTTVGSAFALVSGGLGVGSGGSSSTGPLVFRRHSVNTTLAREYFTILGKIIRHVDGKALMDETDIFRNLSMIGCHPQLDYLSRVVITALAFHDNGFMSKHLIRIWTSGSPTAGGSRGSGSRGGPAGGDFVARDLFQRGGTSPRYGEDGAESGRSFGLRARSASRLSAQPITGKGRGRCSLGLRNTIYNLFGSILLSRPEDFYSWCLDALVEMMVWELPGHVSLHLVRLLLQVVQGARGLALLIDKLENIRYAPVEDASAGRGKSDKSRSNSATRSSTVSFITGFDLTTESAYHPVLIYFLCLPRGIQYCAKGRGVNGDGQWLASLLSDFETTGARKYVYDYDILAARALNTKHIKTALCPRPRLVPIPLLSRDLSSTYTNTTIAPTNIDATRSTVDAIQTHNTSLDSAFMVKANLGRRKGSFNVRGSTENGDPSQKSSIRSTENVSRASSSSAAIGSTVRSSEHPDLQGLLQMPWNIEVKLYVPGSEHGSGGNGNAGSTQTPRPQAKPEYLQVDTYLDTSDLALSSSGGITSDLNRFVKIRGILLGSDGVPLGKEVKSSEELASCLMAGTCPVSKKGQVSGISASYKMAMQQQENQMKYNPADNINVALGREGLGFDLGADSGVSTSGDDPCPPNSVQSCAGDVPVSYMLEHLHDWTFCSPQERQPSDKTLVQELGNDRFAIHIPGEPCKFVFSRTKPTAASYTDWIQGGNSQLTSSSRKSASDTASGALKMSSTARASRKSINPGATSPDLTLERPVQASNDSSEDNMRREDGTDSHRREGGAVYLLEVQYYLSVLSGQPLFAAVPPHMYGLLARSLEGCALLEAGKIIHKLITKVQHLTDSTTGPIVTSAHPEDYSRDCSSLKESLYSLGQIASSDTGFQAVNKAAHDTRRSKLREMLVARQRAFERASEKARLTPPPPQPLPTIQSFVATDASISDLDRADFDVARARLGDDNIASSSSHDSSDSGLALNNSMESMGVSSTSSSMSPARDYSIPPEPPSRELTEEQAKAEREYREEEWTRLDEMATPLFSFLDWCLRYVSDHPHYGVRNAIFNILGLVSRAPLAKNELSRRKWDSSPTGGSSAVAIPQDHSLLFRRNLEEETRFAAIARSMQVPRTLPGLARLSGSPLALKSGAVEVLHAVSTMQGFIFPARENKSRLERLKRENSQVFKSREAYLALQELLEGCVFRLADRREICGLFPDHVKAKTTRRGGWINGSASDSS